jgi:hypothetical protein
MSALPPKADIGTQYCDVRFVPKADILHCGGDCYSITSSATASGIGEIKLSASPPRPSQPPAERHMVEPRDDCIGRALAILPGSANGAPEGLVDTFTGKPDNVV